MRHEYKIVLDNLRTFFLFLLRKQLKAHLADKRHEIEVELARLVRIVKRLPSGQTDRGQAQYGAGRVTTQEIQR